MSTDSSRGNTYPIDPESPAEMARLINLDRITTKAMGSPFVGIPDPSSLRTVLDLACGPGGWVLDVGFELPAVQVAGIDISRSMVDYANARAHAQTITNASFGVMNLLEPLDFADASFDLVNARLLYAALPKHAWVPLLQECTRILRPGGILRLTDLIDGGVSSSPAFERFQDWTFHALWRMGRGFSVDGRTVGLSHVLPRMLRQAGYHAVEHFAHTLEFSADTEAWADFYHNAEIGYKLGTPALVKVGVVTQEEADRTYEQMLDEMHAADFTGMWHFFTVCGRKAEN